jgi:predicted transcriptional regulator
MSEDFDEFSFEMGDDYADVDIGELAKNVYEYLKKNGGVRIGELVEAFDVPYDLMARALERLRSEGKVVKFVEENYIATYRVWPTDVPPRRRYT